MELERLAVVARERRSWEGLDLGFALARQWFWPLWTLWWLSALPVALIALLISAFQPAWWLLILWWCKPLYEAPLLAWTSRALFGERLTPLAQLTAIWRMGLHGALLGQLLWRRLGLRRSFVMPIGALEGLRGRAARERRRLLLNGDASPTWLTLVCYHFEAILWASLLALSQMLTPEGLGRLGLVAALSDSESLSYWLSALAYVLAISLMAPFYVCAGFALYLTRRTELEAWDLELAFRAARKPEPHPRFSASGRALLLAAGILLPGLLASPPASALPDPETSRALIAEVLADPAFGGEREVRRWRLIEAGEDDQAHPTPVAPRSSTLTAWLAQALRWLLLLAAALALGLVLRHIWRDGRRLWPKRARSRKAPAKGPRPRPDARSTQPPDLALAVRQALERSDLRAALALLYQGSLHELDARGMTLPASATETEVLHHARQHVPDRAALGPLPDIIATWQGLAYGGRSVEVRHIEALLAHWLRWTAQSDRGASHAH